MEYLSFQTPAFVGVGVLGGQVGLADEGQIVARVCEGLDHGCAVADQADADLVEDPRVQFVATSGAGRGFDGVADLLGALQLHRIGPAMPLVHHIAQAVEGGLIAGRRDVQIEGASYQIEGASYRLRAHSDLIPEHARTNAPITPPPAPKRRGRPPKNGAASHING
jgi:hypothetical protein